MSQLVVTGLTERDLEHRSDFERFVLNDAEAWHREHLGRLYQLWHEWNRTYYAGAMTPPYILLSEPSNPRRLGDTGPTSGFGGRSQIRIRPSLVTGTHPIMRIQFFVWDESGLVRSGVKTKSYHRAPTGRRM
jgi:hypothetical protein